ncbi:MAG: hypothetical protein LBC78_01405 [Oscillospiraceae bacterium]|jgi:cell fate regulator YaaT (PSP1 superfamily)|nr:hypothetical protein [Oscillospiraceae bacterium]
MKLTEVISVKFSDAGKIYYFDPRGVRTEKGDGVIVDTANGVEYAHCVEGNHEVADSKVVAPLRPLVRLATEADRETALRMKLRNAEALVKCREKIARHNIPMKLVSAEYSFDGGKLMFFFTAEGRVDFRELVRDLAATFKAKIKLLQIGVRDEAKMLGGLGVCGKQFCCTQFLNDFHPVSIKMAKTQGLSLNPVKISGTCGRLMCCLKYEEEAYEDLVVRAPRVDAFVETPSGKGTVVSVNLLRRSAKIRLEDGNDTTLKTISFDELDVLGGKARRAEYQAAKAEGKLEEAGFKPSVIAPAPPRPTEFSPQQATAERFDHRRNLPPPRERTERNRPPRIPASHAAQKAPAPKLSAPLPEPVKKNNHRRFTRGKKKSPGASDNA